MSRALPAVLVALVVLLVTACTNTSAEPRIATGTSGPSGATADPERPGSIALADMSEPAPPVPAAAPAAICDRQAPGPAQAPPGAVTVDPAVDMDLARKTASSPPGTTFWLAPGTHTLGGDQYGQVTPKDRNVYIGAPGAVLDGRRTNRFAFTQRAQNVTIRNLIVQGFVPPQDQGVVNHDSGNGWVIEDNTIQANDGAGMMAGAGQVVRRNCLRGNGQYGVNAYQQGDGITGLVVADNEIVGNNTADWETRVPGCGCSGGLKFWAVNGADVRGNWIHGNRSVGLWADTNDNNFLIEGNLIENNDSEGVFYEISYNLVLRSNLIRGNAIVKGKKFADRGDSFPVAAVYLSESGGDSRVPARTDKVDISGNRFENNWSGITAWENADRFCNSPANTSARYCTPVVPNRESCSQPGISVPPLRDDCRWKTRNVDVHDNEFVTDPAVLGCPSGQVARMAVLSNFGTYPAWSPYKGPVVQEAITFGQSNVWRSNTYVGPWQFMVQDPGTTIAAEQWQAAPYGQDKDSEFSPEAGSC